MPVCQQQILIYSGILQQSETSWKKNPSDGTDNSVVFFLEGRMMDNLLKNNGLEHKRPGALPALICHHLGA